MQLQLKKNKNGDSSTVSLIPRGSPLAHQRFYLCNNMSTNHIQGFKAGYLLSIIYLPRFGAQNQRSKFYQPGIRSYLLRLKSCFPKFKIQFPGFKSHFPRFKTHYQEPLVTELNNQSRITTFLCSNFNTKANECSKRSVCSSVSMDSRKFRFLLHSDQPPSSPFVNRRSPNKENNFTHLHTIIRHPLQMV